MSAQTDLQHFLKLSAAQIANRIKTKKNITEKNPATGGSASINKMCMLEELIKEQIAHENTEKNISAATGPTR